MWSLHVIQVLVLVPGLVSAYRLVRRRWHRFVHGRPIREQAIMPLARTLRPSSTRAEKQLATGRNASRRHWARMAAVLEQPIGHAEGARGMQRQAEIQVDAAETMLRRLIEDTVAVSDYARRRVAEGWAPAVLATGNRLASAA